MQDDKRQTTTVIVGGAIAVFATVYMAAGRWEVFDVALSLVFLMVGYHYICGVPHILGNRCRQATLAVIFSVPTTALIIALCSILFVIFKWRGIARFDWHAAELLARKKEALLTTERELL